jgi:hypothetical protein
LIIAGSHPVDICIIFRHVYKRWNERLFQEMFLAYEDGRGGKEPTEGWYNGELWFFDNYVIPLAKKLEECGVFGVSSDECLNYALENRKEVRQLRSLMILPTLLAFVLTFLSACLLEIVGCKRKRDCGRDGRDIPSMEKPW